MTSDDRERIKAEVVYWGLQEAQHGRVRSEAELEQEFERRIAAAQGATAQPAWQSAPGAPSQPAARSGTAPASEADKAPMVTRRGTLKAVGLAGIQAITALGALKIGQSPMLPGPLSNFFGGGQNANQNGVPADVAAAGGSNPVDGSADPDATAIDQVKLAAINNGRSLYAVFHGATKNPFPGHLDRLFPVAAQAAAPGRLREFSLEIQDKTLEIAHGVKFAAWTFNGAIPGPVIRVTQGDHVRITLKNSGAHPHSLHLHSIHAANQDGVFQIIPPGGTGVYDFVAQPFGVFPYHCHIDPLDQHVSRGLYGVMIIDPPKPRPAAKEMVMLINGYDTNFDKNNELYSVNGMPGYYHDNPIDLKSGELNRVYLVNMTEYDAVNSFHFHANMFSYYPAGTSLTPSFVNDVVHLGVADRGILEFTYNFPGQYLFHAHQNELTIHGWVGLFNVT